MSNLRRYYKDGSLYFVTNVTLDRAPILLCSASLLLNTLTQKIPRDQLIAWVILPDHFHAVIDPGCENLSNLLRRVKLSFSSFYRLEHESYSGRLWQYRFWDHIIRDQDDLNRHIDYVHFNPVKHGYVADPKDWEWSSFRDFLGRGMYQENWGVSEQLRFDGDYGE